MAIQCVTIRFRILNERALTALAEAAEIIEELKEDLPWRDEPGRAAECLRYALDHLKAEVR